MRKIILLLIVLLLADIASAATLHGQIYDIELNELNGVVVTVDSIPQQRYVSKDGAYSFELNPGTYQLTANYSVNCLEDCSTTETVTVDKEGDYVFDLFIFPSLDTEDEFITSDEEMEDAEIPDGEAAAPKNEADGSSRTILIVSAVLVVLGAAFYSFGRTRKKPKDDKTHASQGKPPAKEEITDDYLRQVIEILRKEEGRTTQKELRKQIPLSEAKISLMVAELEHKGIVQKVKKGRGNIIILKRR